VKGILWRNVPAQLKWTVVALVLMYLLAFVPPSKAAALTERHPIHITSNSEFTAANGVVGGSGTQDDPYIIEGWKFTEVYYDSDYGIWLENTDAYVVIKNCFVCFAGADTSMRLEHVANVAIENVTLVGGEKQALYVHDSRNITVYKSEMRCAGGPAVELANVNNTMFIDCRIGRGRYYAVELWGGSNIAFKRCEVHDASDGLYLRDGKNISVCCCDIHGCDEDGAYLQGRGFTISNCTIHDNAHGIALGSAYDATVQYCEFRNNEVGVYCYGYHCEIHYNNFINNTAVNAQDELFHEGPNYNNWDDYRGVDANGDGYGDTPYQLPGSAGSKDNQPLMRPVRIIPEVPSPAWLLITLAAASLPVLAWRKTKANGR